MVASKPTDPALTGASKASVNVAVAVIVNAAREVLISFRHPELHQGNLWEFPGGKLEADESIESALRRELMEELGLTINSAFPLKTINYQYPDKAVCLQVWRITAWSGEARGLEGQAVQWKPVSTLDAADFPAANAPIVRLLQLPDFIAITPVVHDLPELLALMRHLCEQRLPVLQLRQPQLSQGDYLRWFEQANAVCEDYGVTLMFNGDRMSFEQCSANGYHATAARLQALTARPVAENQLFSASCHNLAELRKAVALNADFVTLSPVAQTAKYPASHVLGWSRFTALLRQVSVPIYAMGGLQHADLTQARQAGAHGIGGIGLFLPKA